MNSLLSINMIIVNGCKEQDLTNGIPQQPITTHYNIFAHWAGISNFFGWGAQAANKLRTNM